MILARSHILPRGICLSHVIQEQKRLIDRVRRLRGQIDGVERAIVDEKDCGDVLLTLSACRGAVNALMAEILDGHVRHHVLRGKRATLEQQHAADELLKVINRYLK